MLSEIIWTYIPIGVTHALENPGKMCYSLEIIEVQSGSYLGEDDIVRIADNYGDPERTQGQSSALGTAVLSRDRVAACLAKFAVQRAQLKAREGEELRQAKPLR